MSHPEIAKWKKLLEKNPKLFMETIQKNKIVRPTSGKDLHQRLPPELWDQVSEHFGGVSDFKNMNKALDSEVYNKHSGPAYKKAHLSRAWNKIHNIPYKHLLKPAGSSTDTDFREKLAELLVRGLTGDANRLFKSEINKNSDDASQNAMEVGDLINYIILGKGKYGVFDWNNVKSAVKTIVGWVAHVSVHHDQDYTIEQVLNWLIYCYTKARRTNRHVYSKLLKIWLKECIRQNIVLGDDFLSTPDIQMILATLH